MSYYSTGTCHIPLSKFPSKALLDEQLEILINEKFDVVTTLGFILWQSDGPAIARLFTYALHQLVNKASKLVNIKEFTFWGDFLLYQPHLIFIEQIIKQFHNHAPNFHYIIFSRVVLSTKVITRLLFLQQQHNKIIENMESSDDNNNINRSDCNDNKDKTTDSDSKPTRLRVKINGCGWFLETPKANDTSSNDDDDDDDKELTCRVATNISLPFTLKNFDYPNHSVCIVVHKMSIDLTVAQHLIQKWQELLRYTKNYLPHCDKLICTNSTITTDALEYLLSVHYADTTVSTTTTTPPRCSSLLFFIRHLSLDDMQLNDEQHAKALANILRSNTTLEKLSIYGNKDITNIGLKYILNNVFKTNMTLKEFRFGHYKVQHDAWIKKQIEFFVKLNKMGQKEILLQSDKISPILLPMILENVCRWDYSKCFWILKTLPHLLQKN